MQLVSLLENAGKTRCSAETLRNSSSSRSHAIYRLTISRRFTKDSVIDESTKAGTEPFSIAAEQGSLYLVDLAGSEIARDTSQHTTERLRETILINTSLAALKDCIRAQARSTSEKSERKLSRNPHVPFRRAVLTRVLKHVFEPTELRDTRSAVIACINPNVLDVAATKNTLKYSEMLRNAVA